MCGIDIVVVASAHDMVLPDIELVDGDLGRTVSRVEAKSASRSGCSWTYTTVGGRVDVIAVTSHCAGYSLTLS